MDNQTTVYDLLIVGSGPAGLTASIYASRYRLKHLVLGSQLGGAASWAAEIENYPGFKKISGLELTQKMADHVQSLGAEIKNQEVISLAKNKDLFEIKTADNQIFMAKTVIFASGTQRRKLNIPGEKEYLGKGVSYCTTCDGAFFKEGKVAIIGGSNAAAMGASHLAEFANQVYLIYRKEALRADPIWTQRVQNDPKIKIIYQTNLVEILGDGNKVTGVKLDKVYENQDQLILDGVFIEIGGVPGTDLVGSIGVKLDEKGFIHVEADMRTNIDGIWAAGDVANASGEFQQIITAAAEGALAANSVYKYLSKTKGGVVNEKQH